MSGKTTQNAVNTAAYMQTAAMHLPEPHTTQMTPDVSGQQHSGPDSDVSADTAATHDGSIVEPQATTAVGTQTLPANGNVVGQTSPPARLPTGNMENDHGNHSHGAVAGGIGVVSTVVTLGKTALNGEELYSTEQQDAGAGGAQYGQDTGCCDGVGCFGDSGIGSSISAFFASISELFTSGDGTS